jgi:hypothetical protein
MIHRFGAVLWGLTHCPMKQNSREKGARHGQRYAHPDCCRRPVCDRAGDSDPAPSHFCKVNLGCDASPATHKLRPALASAPHPQGNEDNADSATVLIFKAGSGQMKPSVERKGNRNGQHHHDSSCRRCLVRDRAGYPHPAPPHSHKVTAAPDGYSSTWLTWSVAGGSIVKLGGDSTAAVPAHASSDQGRGNTSSIV